MLLHSSAYLICVFTSKGFLGWWCPQCEAVHVTGCRGDHGQLNGNYQHLRGALDVSGDLEIQCRIYLHLKHLRCPHGQPTHFCERWVWCKRRGREAWIQKRPEGDDTWCHMKEAVLWHFHGIFPFSYCTLPEVWESGFRRYRWKIPITRKVLHFTQRQGLGQLTMLYLWIFSQFPSSFHWGAGKWFISSVILSALEENPWSDVESRSRCHRPVC